MKDPLGILQDTDTQQAGTSDPLGLLSAEEAPKREVNTGVSLSDANAALRKNADVMKALDLWDTYSNLLTKSKADDEIRLAEDMIAKGKYDKDTQRVIRQRALSKADAIMKEGKMPDPNRPEASWWESVKSIFPRTLATTGQAAGGVIQNIGEVTGSKGLAETGRMLYKGASMAEKEATPNVPYGSAKETVGNIGVSSLQQIPLMFMTMLPGGKALSLGSFFTLAYGPQYGKRREEKAGVAESMLSAFGQGSSEWVFEIIPVSAAAKIFTSKFANLEKVGWRWLKGEFGGESINTFTQSLQSWAEKYPEKPFSEWLDTLPAEIKDTFIQTLGQSLILGTVGVPVVKARQAAYVHGVTKDIAKRTNLSPEEIKPIVNEALKETKADETGKAFVSTLQARINEIVKNKNDELTNKATLSDEWKKTTTDMLNDPANPASIIDIEKEIARNREENPKKAAELQKFLEEYKSTLSTDDLNRLTIESEGSKLDAGPLAEGWLSPTGQSNILKDLDVADKVQRIWEQFFPESEAKGAPRSYADRVETEREGEPTYTAQGKLIKPEVPGIPQRQTEETPSTLPVDETLKAEEGKDIGEGEKLEPKLEIRNYEGTIGDRSHITRTENGTIPTSSITHLQGESGEKRGEHRNRTGKAWEEFKEDIRKNGIKHPILILKDPGKSAVISEGNHRLDAAVELGLKEIPVDIRYFGHSEKEGLAYEQPKEKPELTKKEKPEKLPLEENPYPYYTYFTKYPKFLPLMNKLRKGMDLNLDPSFISFVQKFNEDMSVGNIPHKLSPSGTIEWSEDEVQSLIMDEMARRKSKPENVAPITITATDEELQAEGFIEEKVEEIIEDATINIQGIKEELYEEGYTDSEINAIIEGIKAASDNQIAGREFEERLAALKEQVRTPPKEEITKPAEEGSLFDTSSMFTLSGNQPTVVKKFEKGEQKGERLFDVEKQSTEELKDRLSGEKAKKEYEGEKAKPTWGAENKTFTAEEAEKARQRLKEMLNELNVGINPELLMVGMKLAGFHIEAGARKFKDYSARMIEDVGDKIKPYLKSLYLAVRNYPGFDNTGMETEAEIEKGETEKPTQAKQSGLTMKSYTPEDIFSKIKDHGFSVELSNDWKIKRKKIANETRIEITGPDYRHIDELKRHGVFVERVNWETRYFIPTTNEGIETIRAITASRPVVNTIAPLSTREDLGTRPQLKLTTSSDLSAFSVDIKPPKEPRYSVEQVKQFLAGSLHRWPNVGEVKVVKTAGELPVRFMGAVVEGDTVMGAYDDETDTIYIIADAIGSARAAVVTLVHEAVGHRGIHAVLGRSEEKVVMAQIARVYENSPMLQKIAKDYGFDMNRDDAAQSIFKKPWIELSDSEQRRTEEEVQKNRRAAAGELIAHMAESREQPGIFKRIIGMIRAALRRGFPSLRWTDTDILHLIERSRRFSGVVPKGKTGVYFKKSSERDNIASMPSKKGPSTSTPKPRTLQEILAEAKTQPTIFDDRMAKESEPPSHDASPDDIKAWMRRETGAIFSHLTRTIGTESDFGKFLESMLKSPEWWTNPTLKRIVHYFADTRSELYHEYVYHLNNIDGRNVTKETEDMAKKSPEKYKQLMWAIDYGDTSWRRGKDSMERLRDPSISREARLAVVENQVRKYEQYLRSKGLPEDVIDLWKLHRASYDRALDLMTEQMRDMIAELEQEAADLGIELPDSKKELLKTLNGWLANMEEWRGFYAPRLRQMGDWSLQLEKDGEKVRFHGSARQMESLLRKLRAEGWEPLTTKDGTEIPPIQKVKRLPEEVYQSLKSVDVAKAINFAMERSANTAEVTTAFNDEVLELVSDMMKARGFRSTMIHRMEGKVIKGYEDDPIIRYVRYTNNISSGLAKAKVARLAYEEVLGKKNEKGKREGGLHPVDDKSEYVLAQRYITAQLRNLDHTDRLIGMAKSLATFKFLGINPRSIMVNLTALATTAPASVHQYAGEGAVNMHRVLKELVRAAKDASAIIVGKEPNLSTHEKEYIEKIKKEGWDDPQYTKDALGAMQKTHQKWFNKTMAASMWAFGKSEQLNRLATLLAGYRIAYGEALKRGMEGKEAEKYAEEKAKKGSDKAHGIYGRATLPMIAQLPYIGKIGQLMYVYGKFGHNYVQMLYDLGMNQHNYKAFVWGLLSPLVLAGGTVLPFKDILWSILGYILRMFGIGGDPEKGLWDWIRRQFGKQAETMGRYGLMGGLGMDISGSLAVGIDFPKSWSDFLGAPWAIVEDIGKAHHFLETGRPWRAAEKVLPVGLANISRAFREQREGLTTERGNRVFTDQGKIYHPSLGEMALRIAGFRSSQEATLSARTTEAKREKAYFEEKKRTIYEEYRAYLANPSKKEHEAVIQKVQEFNKQLREEGIKEVPRITFEQMRAQMKRMQKPTKAQQRLYAE